MKCQKNVKRFSELNSLWAKCESLETFSSLSKKSSKFYCEGSTFPHEKWLIYHCRLLLFQMTYWLMEWLLRTTDSRLWEVCYDLNQKTSVFSELMSCSTVFPGLPWQLQTYPLLHKYSPVRNRCTRSTCDPPRLSLFACRCAIALSSCLTLKLNEYLQLFYLAVG